MNYRHAFHAGNFADVLKHATLARILLHLGAKPTAFRVIDTHAGRACTTWSDRKQAAPANGATESAGCAVRRLLPTSLPCSRPTSMQSAPSMRAMR